MIKQIVFVFFISLFVQLATAQKVSVSGNLSDTSTGLNLKNAVVSILTPKDSVLAGFTRVKTDGSWEVNNILPGNYVLSVTHPLFADFVDNIEVKANEKIPAISMTPKSKLLEAVIVKSGNPIRIKGDTTIYTADSFKVSANANVEELLKKMPGFQIDKNGQIKAMGETVEKILVDGEEFFGDDPGMTIKNLRADAVKEVQVFDKKSDQSEFTGIDDGKTKKTINLKLKEDKKKGYFGKIDGAGGWAENADPRYNTNILFSSFKGKRKLSGFVLSGNTGQDGLSWQDEQKYGGESDNVAMSMDEDGGMMYTWRGGGSDEEPYLDPENGFITNLNAGAQYSNKFNDKTTVNFSPKYNSQRYNNDKTIYRQTLLSGDSSFNENSAINTDINRYNVKLRGTYDVKIDSMNTLKLSANANFYHTKSDEKKLSFTRDQDSVLTNSSSRDFDTDNDKQAISGNVIFKHKFQKARRTISATADWKTTTSDGINFLKSVNNDFVNGFSQNIDQMKDFDKASTNAAAKITYTEPLGKKYSLEIGYQLGLNFGTNDQTTYTKSAAGKYETAVDSLTNNFRQNIKVHSPSAKINYSFKKLKINAGAGVSISDFQLKDLTLNKTYDRNYTNFFPSANFSYAYKSNHNLRINYSGTTKQPTIDQLQPLRNNNDIFNQYIGNPDLKPSFTNNFSISHNTYNFIKDIWTYQSVNINLVSNAITNNRVIERSGKITTQPINTDGNLNLSAWTGAGFKVKKIDTRFQISPNVSYNRYADVINSVTTYSKNLALGSYFSVSKSKDKKYDVSLNDNIQYNKNSTSQSNSELHYVTNTASGDATVYYKKIWSLNSSYELYTRQKTEGAKGFSNSMWNARIQRTFKSDEFTAYVSVRDILNQNKGIDREFYSNTFTETRNERLKRYFLIGFTWNFKNKAVKK